MSSAPVASVSDWYTMRIRPSSVGLHGPGFDRSQRSKRTATRDQIGRAQDRRRRDARGQRNENGHVVHPEREVRSRIVRERRRVGRGRHADLFPLFAPARNRKRAGNAEKTARVTPDTPHVVRRSMSLSIANVAWPCRRQAIATHGRTSAVFSTPAHSRITVRWRDPAKKNSSRTSALRS